MSKQIDEDVASGTQKYVSRKRHVKLYQPAPGCPPACAEPAGEDRLPLPSAGGSSRHLVHYRAHTLARRQTGTRIMDRAQPARPCGSARARRRRGTPTNRGSAAGGGGGFGGDLHGRGRCQRCQGRGTASGGRTQHRHAGTCGRGRWDVSVILHVRARPSWWREAAGLNQAVVVHAMNAPTTPRDRAVAILPLCIGV